MGKPIASNVVSLVSELAKRRQQKLGQRVKELEFKAGPEAMDVLNNDRMSRPNIRGVPPEQRDNYKEWMRELFQGDPVGRETAYAPENEQEYINRFMQELLEGDQ